jgi:4-amino-4-deoxy-L-arabinose transferase-like glycosyltransferase
MSPRAITVAWLAVLAVALVLRFGFLGTPDLVGGDEGYYGTYARNIIEGGTEQLVNLGREPLSKPDNKPFLFPLLLAGSIGVFGANEWALRLIPALAGLAAAWAAGAMVRRRFGLRAALASAAMVLLLPPLVYGSRVVMGELVLAAFGLGGAFAAVKAIEERRTWLAAAAGALWGCGFLVKLWLVGLFILPVLVTLIADRNRRLEIAAWARMVLAGVVFVAVGGLHLWLVMLLSPETLRYWFEQYFIFSLFGRAGGAEFADYWHQPWTYYLRTTLQTCFMVMPLACLGAVTRPDPPADQRETPPMPQRTLWIVLALEILAISMMGVKIRQYSFPLLPALAVLAGLGLHACLLGLRSRRAAGWAAGLSLLTVLPLALWQFGEAPLFPSTALFGAAALVLVGSAALLALAAGLPRWAPAAGLLLALGATVAAAGASALTVQRECLNHETGYREAAAVMAPALVGIHPTEACFLAPEVPSFQFYLFRTGRYWASPYEPHTSVELIEWAGTNQMRAFVTTDRTDLYAGLTPPDVVEWLAANTTEVTDQVRERAGHDVPIRVFVKAAGEDG